MTKSIPQLVSDLNAITNELTRRENFGHPTERVTAAEADVRTLVIAAARALAALAPRTPRK